MQTNKTIPPTSIKTVCVKAHARLHMGFFDLHGGLGRKFGSLGVALANPVTELTASLSDKLVITGSLKDGEAEVIAKAVAEVQKALGIETSLDITVKQLIPRHLGLGSGTQIKLALLAVFDNLNQLNLEHNDIAMASGRGLRSGIGLATFQQGGAVVDAGRRTVPSGLHVEIPPVIARVEFPESWKILLVFDDSKQGVHGNQELEAFKCLPEFPESLADRLSRHVLMQALPALHERDLNAFGAAVLALQKATGEHFASAQGGLYASNKVTEVFDWCKKEGIACFGQTSWGPTGFVVFEDEELANDYLVRISDYFSPQKNLKFMLTEAVNTGATLLVC